MLFSERLLRFQEISKPLPVEGGAIYQAISSYDRYVKDRSKESIFEFSNALINLGDPEYSLQLLENNFSFLESDTDYIRKLFEAYVSFQLYDDAYDLLCNSVGLIEKECLSSLSWILFEKISENFDLDKLIFFEKHIFNKEKRSLVNGAIGKTINLRGEIHALGDNFFEHIEKLKLEKRTSEMRSLLSAKVFLNDPGSEALSTLCRSFGIFSLYFKNRMSELGGDEYFKIKYSYILSLNALGLFRKAKSILDRSFSFDVAAVKKFSGGLRDLYYIYIRINIVLGYYPRFNILSEEVSKLSGLGEPNKFESRFIKNFWENNSSSAKISSRKRKVALVISGQIRGEINFEHFSKFDFADKRTIATWNFAAVTRARWVDIFGVLDRELISTLNKDHRNLEFLEIYFPKTLKKYKDEISGLRMPASDLIGKSGIKFDDLDICDEDEFEERFSSSEYLKVDGKLNQAKMFYMLDKSINHSSALDDSDVIIRTRPDLVFDFDDEIIKYCIDECNSNENLIFVPCVSHSGFSDQFAIGSKYAMQKYAGIWNKINSSSSFRYSEDFEYRTSRGAEPLVANHLLSEGLEVRLVKLHGRALLNPKLPSEIIDVAVVLNDDYRALNEARRNEFRKFFEKLSSRWLVK